MNGCDEERETARQRLRQTVKRRTVTPEWLEENRKKLEAYEQARRERYDLLDRVFKIDATPSNKPAQQRIEPAGHLTSQSKKFYS